MNKITFVGIALAVALSAGGCASYTGAFEPSFARLKSQSESICVTTTYIPNVGKIAQCTVDVKQTSDVDVEVYVQLKEIKSDATVYISEVLATCRYRLSSERYTWIGGYLSVKVFGPTKEYVVLKQELQLAKGSYGTGSYQVQYCPGA
jgi:hypothetical protein